MTYAKIVLPFNPKEFKVKSDPKTKQKLKGRITSAMKKGGAAVKNAIKNPTQTFKNLSKYLTDNSEQAAKSRQLFINKTTAVTNTVVNKFSGIAVAQALANGNVTNKQALDYLFMGFAPAMDKEYLAQGYSSVSQMKDAFSNGNVNVGSFINGFTGTLKAITDYNNSILSKDSVKNQNVMELDITLNFSEQYQCETPDRRVQNGKSYAEVIHNMPDVFSIDCGLQDGKRYSVSEFRSILTYLRDSKQVFSMIIGEDNYENLTLLNFNNSGQGARSGKDYTLQIKKINIGSIELVPITIQPLPQQAAEGNGSVSSVSGNVSTPNYVNNPSEPNSKKVQNINCSAAYGIKHGVFNIRELVNW